MFDGKGERIVVAKKKLMAILKGKGIVGKNITAEELGLEKGFDRFALDAAIRDFIGEEILADVSQEQALIFNENRDVRRELLESVQEKKRLESLQATLEVLDEALKLDPRLLNIPASLVEVADLLSRYGIPQNAAITGQLLSRIRTASVRESERQAGLDEAVRTGLEESQKRQELGADEARAATRIDEERVKGRIGFETVEVDDTYPSYVEGERKSVRGRVTAVSYTHLRAH